jgi:hypothetical protein
VVATLATLNTAAVATVAASMAALVAVLAAVVATVVAALAALATAMPAALVTRSIGRSTSRSKLEAAEAARSAGSAATARGTSLMACPSAAWLAGANAASVVARLRQVRVVFAVRAINVDLRPGGNWERSLTASASCVKQG